MELICFMLSILMKSVLKNISCTVRLQMQSLETHAFNYTKLLVAKQHVV